MNAEELKAKQERIRSDLIDITKSRPLAYQIIKYLASENVCICEDDYTLQNSRTNSGDIYSAGFKKCFPLTEIK